MCILEVALTGQGARKKWDQPCSLGGPPGAQDPKKTCNLETYLDWSARLRLFVCNEILQCGGIRDRSKTVELWSGVAQYCLLVGNYNSATAILETLESPPIARLKITMDISGVWAVMSMHVNDDAMGVHTLCRKPNPVFAGCGMSLWQKRSAGR
ncbi:hypothetical protein GQX74_010459 [Glossina fuscipes]|nr:hypothetical protein GQX74_010459 [Glossina fuscipes]